MESAIALIGMAGFAVGTYITHGLHEQQIKRLAVLLQQHSEAHLDFCRSALQMQTAIQQMQMQIALLSGRIAAIQMLQQQGVSTDTRVTH